MPNGNNGLDGDNGDIAALDGGSNGGLDGGLEPAPKRGRGRPKRDSGGGVETIDPADIGSGSGAGDGGSPGGSGGGAKRGRRPGARSSVKAVPLNLDTLVIALTAAQLTAFKLTELPECVLSPDQNKNLADALQRVSRHYPVVISEKAADITALVVCAGNIVFTQWALYNKRVSPAKIA